MIQRPKILATLRKGGEEDTRRCRGKRVERAWGGGAGLRVNAFLQMEAADENGECTSIMEVSMSLNVEPIMRMGVKVSEKVGVRASESEDESYAYLSMVRFDFGDSSWLRM